MMVPIQVIRWYRMQCYDGTDSCATVVPIRRYCHEIKNWSREDRSNLAELIQMSLYYEEDGNDDLINQLSPELLKELAEYAVKEHHAGRCLTQEQVEKSVMEAMG